MTQGELAELLHHCPTLYHMAEAGSWPSIQRHGLLSTTALLDLFEVADRTPIEALRRPACVTLTHPVHGTAVVRDQKPMTDGALRRCLQDGLAPTDWYRLINGRVYFWLNEARLTKLLAGKEYRDRPHDVLEIDTAAFVAAYRDRIELSAINSGATFALGPAPRGLTTFRTIDAFDYAARRNGRRLDQCVVEMTVRYAVPDIARFVRSCRSSVL